MTVCQCGRAYTHCMFCGSKNLYPMKVRSLSRTAEVGKMTTVYRCKKCGQESDSVMECIAAPEVTTTDFVPQKKEQKLLTGNLKPGSLIYAQAMNEWVQEYAEEKGITILKAYVEAKKVGWQVDAYDMDEDLKEAMKLADLEIKDPIVTSLPLPEEQEPEIAPIGLDDIIKGMQEEQK